MTAFNGGIETTAPMASDRDRAESFLNEIAKLCGKHACVLVHKPDCIVLAVPQKHTLQYRAIAQITQIGANGYQWRPVEWNPSKVVKQ